jgi:predicted RNase H-like HicB family nuclease
MSASDAEAMDRAMSETQELHVNVRHEDDSLWATVDEFPGVFATGDNLGQRRTRLRVNCSGSSVEFP